MLYWPLVIRMLWNFVWNWTLKPARWSAGYPGGTRIPFPMETSRCWRWESSKGCGNRWSHWTHRNHFKSLSYLSWAIIVWRKTLHTSWISEWFESPLVFCLMHFRLRCLDSKVVTTATALPWEVMSHTFTGSNPVKGMQRWLDMMFSEDYYVAAFHALSYPVHPMYATFVHTSASGYVSSLFLALGRCFHPKNGPSHLWLTHDEVHDRSLSGDHLM